MLLGWYHSPSCDTYIKRGTFGALSEGSYGAAPYGSYGPYGNKRGNSRSCCW